jgi:catechol 2,3-dioxygenase-like lactoylglutathione lyase family enzyme
MTTAHHRPLFRKIDCLRVPVPDLDAGLAFYQSHLGHELIWRTPTQAGLRLPESDAELVLQTEQPTAEVNLLVASAAEAVARIVDAGGRVVVPPFDIRIGHCVVIQDPWGNHLTLLDMSKGTLVTDANGNVIGPPDD